jgi:hypothetical protein
LQTNLDTCEQTLYQTKKATQAMADQARKSHTALTQAKIAISFLTDSPATVQLKNKLIT